MEPFTHRNQTRGHSLGKQFLENRKEKKWDRLNTTIVFSVSRNEHEKGDYLYNGGIKLLFNWMNVLISHGYDAKFVTHDGSYPSWTEYEPPIISLDELKVMKRRGKELLFVTSWLLADEFIELADQYYFYDCELAYTAGSHYSGFASGSHYNRLRKFLKKRRIVKIATHSRTQQAWYMTKFGFKPDLIPIWIETESRASTFNKTVDPICIGYMLENRKVVEWVKTIEERLSHCGIRFRLVEIKGNESECIELMSECSIYLGFNVGKSPVFGEGSPLPQIEAMLQGAVVIAFDVCGNREYLIDYFNGYVVESGDIEGMYTKLHELSSDLERLEEMRKNSIEIAKTFARDDLKWNRVSSFLEIN